MASALTAGATTTEPQYIRVPDSAGARPMHPPARPPGQRTASAALLIPQTQHTQYAALIRMN